MIVKTNCIIISTKVDGRAEVVMFVFEVNMLKCSRTSLNKTVCLPAPNLSGSLSHTHKRTKR